MCGIYCSMPIPHQKGQNVVVAIEAELKHLLERRGPDASQIITIDGITFGGFVLRQQGDILCTQPVEVGDIVLLLNGDIFGSDCGVDAFGDGIESELKQYKFSDTMWLAHQLAQCHNDAAYCALLQHVEGPYALIFYNKRTNSVYYARDSLGRNSLLLEKRETSVRLLSTSYFSARNPAECVMELPPCGLYKVNALEPIECTLYPWMGTNVEYYATQLKSIEKIFNSLVVGNCIQPKWLDINHQQLLQQQEQLQTVNNLNFDFYELYKSQPKEFISSSNDIMHKLLNSSVALEKALEKFSTLFEHSIRDRVQKTTKLCRDCIVNKSKLLQKRCYHAKTALLFSGGIDCTILACVADKYVAADEPIDLINVAFEAIKNNRNNDNNNGNDMQWLVPDRLTAKESLIELQRLCPDRKWNLIEVNVTRTEMHENLENHLKHLIYPLNTVLDESIGTCFWYAANGRACTTARVVLVGSGADELFGGYQRHRRAFERCIGDLHSKQQCVQAELTKDWLRIATRNLARDDRVVADSSRTLRAPFIEEHVVHFINTQLHPNQRCCFLLPEGLGDKLFLRLYGWRLGLRSAVAFKKRAIQFGSKIANKKQNADDQSIYLQFV